MYMLIYVDDIVVASSSDDAVSKLIGDLQQDFALKDLGDLHYFLGVEVRKQKGGVILCQSKYIIDLLARTGMAQCKEVIFASEKLIKGTKKELSAEDITRYQSTVGALQYLNLTRPDITFPVNKVYQFMQAPTEEHWSAVKMILHYLKYTEETGLQFHKSSSSFISAFSDADWA
ncbi:uncharacterized mitochondrial protein AtMg00810-like [Phragmites australis]|uniref:uncharacterized mitochondrial protein AtMg00810-like n=1 Tax=Phragmites australis TaxID=29695 RepID=UPI002D779459|nr:uncharacterized mitochondrial protein AtMg00810-like [Phragmites australis]